MSQLRHAGSRAPAATSRTRRDRTVPPVGTSGKAAGTFPGRLRDVWNRPGETWRSCSDTGNARRPGPPGFRHILRCEKTKVLSGLGRNSRSPTSIFSGLDSAFRSTTRPPPDPEARGRSATRFRPHLNRPGRSAGLGGPGWRPQGRSKISSWPGAARPTRNAAATNPASGENSRNSGVPDSVSKKKCSGRKIFENFAPQIS